MGCLRLLCRVTGSKPGHSALAQGLSHHAGHYAVLRDKGSSHTEMPQKDTLSQL